MTASSRRGPRQSPSTRPFTWWTLLHHLFGTHGYNHKARQQILKTENRFRTIYKHYRCLRGASEIARYLQDGQTGKEYRTFSDYLAPARVQSEILNYRLRELERSVTRLLAQ